MNIMCSVNPEYNKYVWYKNGKKVLYLKVLRSIYGCIESALLWCNLYSLTLKGLGFKVNIYDRFVANKMVDGKKCTLVWYMDDNQLSHVNPNVVTNILNIFRKHFGVLWLVKGKAFILSQD